jgi:hypothetical protein
MSNNGFETIPGELLAHAHGGMRYTDSDRQSDNVEDRRTDAGKAADQKWYDDNKGDYNRGGGSVDLPKPQPLDPTKDMLPGPRE